MIFAKLHFNVADPGAGFEQPNAPVAQPTAAAPPQPMEVELDYAQLRQTYSTQLEQMREFGFTNDEESIRALHSCDGQLEPALELVITMRESWSELLFIDCLIEVGQASCILKNGGELYIFFWEPWFYNFPVILCSYFYKCCNWVWKLYCWIKYFLKCLDLIFFVNNSLCIAIKNDWIFYKKLLWNVYMLWLNKHFSKILHL